MAGRERERGGHDRGGQSGQREARALDAAVEQAPRGERDHGEREHGVTQRGCHRHRGRTRIPGGDREHQRRAAQGDSRQGGEQRAGRAARQQEIGGHRGRRKHQRADRQPVEGVDPFAELGQQPAGEGGRPHHAEAHHGRNQHAEGAVGADHFVARADRVARPLRGGGDARVEHHGGRLGQIEHEAGGEQPQAVVPESLGGSEPDEGDPIEGAQDLRQREHREDRQPQPDERPAVGHPARAERHAVGRPPEPSEPRRAADEPPAEKPPYARPPHQGEPETRADRGLHALSRAHGVEVAVGLEARRVVLEGELEPRRGHHQERWAVTPGDEHAAPPHAEDRHHDRAERRRPDHHHAPRRGHDASGAFLIPARRGRRKLQLQTLQGSDRRIATEVEDQVQGVPGAEATRPERGGRRRRAEQQQQPGQIMAGGEAQRMPHERGLARAHRQRPSVMPLPRSCPARRATARRAVSTPGPPA